MNDRFKLEDFERPGQPERPKHDIDLGAIMLGLQGCAQLMGGEGQRSTFASQLEMQRATVRTEVPREPWQTDDADVVAPNYVTADTVTFDSGAFLFSVDVIQHLIGFFDPNPMNASFDPTNAKALATSCRVLAFMACFAESNQSQQAKRSTTSLAWRLCVDAIRDGLHEVQRVQGMTPVHELRSQQSLVLPADLLTRDGRFSTES